MLRFLKNLIFVLVLLIAFPIGILVLISWWQRRRDEYTISMMNRDSAPAIKPTTAIEIPPAMLASNIGDMEAPACKETAKEAAPGGVVEGVKVRLAPVKMPSTQDDDLRRIEGIGPKIAGLLQKAGITAFAQLAKTDAARLKEILEAANLPFINPETWPAQADLAARADWDSLDKFQAELKGGKRV